MNQDTLNKIKSYKNSKYLWLAMGVSIGFLICVCWRIFLIFLVCAVGIVVFVFSSKAIDKIYRKRRRKTVVFQSLHWREQYTRSQINKSISALCIFAGCFFVLPGDKASYYLEKRRRYHAGGGFI